MFYLQREGHEPEVCTSAENAAHKASAVSALFGVRVDVVHQRERDRVVIATAERGVVSNIVPPPEPKAPTPFDQLNKNLTNLANTIKERI